MKLFYVLLITLPLLSHSYPSAEEKAITLEDDSDNEHAETGGEASIQKRSGSFDYVTHLKSGLLSGIGHASASIASGSSGGSSGGGGYKHPEYAHHGNSVDYDPWSFKKSVLNTIFQAVKAITGGVTALKGQLIKGSGYVLNASGKVVAASGDKVTDLGKNIINSAQIHSPLYGPPGHTGGGGASVHPFSKFSSLSSASSGGSSGSKHPGAPPVIHTETITTYEIPSGHSSYGPPSSKPPTYSTATHSYLPPPAGPAYSGGGAPFSGGHASFEAPSTNYVQSGYGYHDAGNDDFNIYGRHQKLSDAEAKKAAAQLQEILHLLPDGKTEFTASKTVTIDTANNEVNPEKVELQTYGLPNDLGPLSSLSHTESITASYEPKPLHQLGESPSDIYRQMAKKQSPEEIYLQRHPNEAYDYSPPKSQDSSNYKFNNYHANGPTGSGGGGGGSGDSLNNLTPIIAALELAKRTGPTQQAISTQYAIEKNVKKYPASPPQQYDIPRQQQQQQQQHNQYNYQQPQVHQRAPHQNYLPPVVQKNKYTYFDPAQHRTENNPQPFYSKTYRTQYTIPKGPPSQSYNRRSRQVRRCKIEDYQVQDPLLFNQMFDL